MIEKLVIRQDWKEHELGWGTRPDGHSLHLTPEDHKEYILEYWSQMPDEAPEEYSCPDGSQFPFMVPDDIYLELKKGRVNGKKGIRNY